MNVPIDDRSALIVVDVQPDFMPGGALACHEGDAIVTGIDAMLKSRVFQHVVATQDWHPAGRMSFASSHAGHQPYEQIVQYGQLQTLWPDHCVQDSAGASLHAGVDWTSLHAVIRKGSNRAVDSYSGFRENHGPWAERPSTGLAGWLRERGVESVYVCGLARDVCVLWTALDAVDLGFRTHLLWDLTRPVTPTTDQDTRATLAASRIAIADAESLRHG